MRFSLSVLCTLLFAPAAATAAPSYLDLYYVPNSELELTDPSGTITSDGGSGMGFRGRIAASDTLALQAEYQKDEYDGFEGVQLATETTSLRLGARFAVEGSPFYGVFEFARFTLDVDGFGEESDSGYGGHIGLEGQGPVRAYTQVGFVDVGDFGNGIEVMAGMVADFGGGLGIFLDYRQSKLEDDSGAEAVTSDIRVGARVAFGR